MPGFIFPAGIDLENSQAYNILYEVLSSAPGSPVVGRYWLNTTTGSLEYRVSGGTKQIYNADQVIALRIDQFANPTGSLNLNSQKIINLADGASAQDAATYGQLLAVLQGRSFKDAVRAATTANITLSGLQTIDGVTLVANDRVLVKDQSSGATNGIYLAASGAWTRALDADTATDLAPSTSVLVQEGTANADKQFTLTTNGPITLGTTALVFAQTGSGTTYVQGTGIIISGSTISIDTSVVTRKYPTNFGDGAATSFTITHGLNTLDVSLIVRRISTGAEVKMPNQAATVNTVTIGTLATAPGINEYRAIVFG